MTYVFPKELNERYKLVRNLYKRNQPHRMRNIDVLESVYTFISQLDLNQRDITVEDLEKVSQAAWIYGIEMISKDTWRPANSTLHHIYLQQLEATNANQIEDKLRFIRMEKLYNFLLKFAGCEKFINTLQEKGLKLDDLRNNTKQILRTQLYRLTPNITGILNAIPTEESMDKQMAELNRKYKDIKKKEAAHKWKIFSFYSTENQDRLFLTQLVEAVNAILPREQQNQSSVQVMQRSQKIKIGLRLCILHLIKSESTFLAPHSALLKLVDLEAFNHLTNHTKLQCLSACKNFLSDHNVLSAIEQFGLNNYKDENFLGDIDIQRVQIDKELNKMIEQFLGVGQVQAKWRAAKSLAQIGAMIMASPGYGVGYVIGYSASDTHSAVSPKLSVCKTLSYFGTSFLGLTRLGFGFLAADFIVQSTLTRAFAKVLEQIGMLIGYATGGAIGIAFDLSYQGLRSLCECCLHLYDNLYDPLLMQNLDIEFIKSLFNLPPEIFSDDKRHKLEDMIQKNDLAIEVDLLTAATEEQKRCVIS